MLSTNSRVDIYKKVGTLSWIQPRYNVICSRSRLSFHHSHPSTAKKLQLQFKAVKIVKVRVSNQSYGFIELSLSKLLSYLRNMMYVSKYLINDWLYQVVPKVCLLCRFWLCGGFLVPTLGVMLVEARDKEPSIRS